MTNRRLGREGARGLAASTSLDQAITQLAQSPYRQAVTVGDSLATAQRAIAARALWNVRVLAGWAPREGVAMLRALVAAVEVVNVSDALRRLSGGMSPEPYDLGPLTTAWPRLARAPTPREVRRTLATSPWGDPRGDSEREIVLAMRFGLAERVIAVVPEAERWARSW